MHLKTDLVNYNEQIGTQVEWSAVRTLWGEQAPKGSEALLLSFSQPGRYRAPVGDRAAQEGAEKNGGGRSNSDQNRADRNHYGGRRHEKV